MISAGRVLIFFDLISAAIIWPVLVFLLLPLEYRPSFIDLALYPIFWILFLTAFGLYRREALVETRKSLARAALAGLLASLSVYFLTVILPLLNPAERGTGPVLALAITGFVILGTLTRVTIFILRQLGALRRRVLVIGAGRRAWDLALLLRREGRSIAYDITFADVGERDPRLIETEGDRVLQPTPTGGFLELAQRCAADEIIIAPDDRRGLPMRALLACKTAGYPVSEYLRFLEREIGRIDIKRLEFGWLLVNDGFTFSPTDRVLKRILDIIFSTILLVTFSPALFIAALAVKIDDRGPAIYRQARVTQGGRIFYILKLRTMRVDAEKMGAVWAAEKDPRITRIGRFLRRTRLDELPQLINVLRGDMSFVGPRPERPEFIQELASQLPLFEERHLVKAGLTGWAQINYPYGASIDDARSKLSYDLYYVKNFGFFLDLMIILQTLRVVIWPGGVR